MIHFEKLEPNDFNTFKSWVSNKDELFQFSGPIFNFPLTDEQLMNYINDRRRISFKVMLTDSNQLIGHCELNFENPLPRLSRILIGEKEFRNKGVGKLIVTKMLEQLFIEREFEKADLNVFDWNLGALKCYQNVGFKIIETIVSEHVNGGEVWRILNMTISKDTWIRGNTRISFFCSEF